MKTKRTSSSAQDGNVQANKDREPPPITRVLSPQQQDDVRTAFAAQGICSDHLRDCTAVKPVVKRLPFIRKITAVPGQKGAYNIVLTGPARKTAQGDFGFAVPRAA